MRNTSNPQRSALQLLWSRFCHILWTIMKFFWSTVVVGFVINIASSLFFLAQGTNIRRLYFWQPWMWIVQHQVQVALFVLALLLLTWIAWKGRQATAEVASSIGSFSPSPESRLVVIEALSREYARQQQHILEGAPPIGLTFHERIDILHSSAQWVFHDMAPSAEHALPPETWLVQAYDAAGRGLLLLGEPGAGKTSSLLFLAGELLERAKQHSNQPIPVILNLSSWARKKPPLDQWIVDQLQLVYGIPPHFSKDWLAHDQWLLLLDGLDEVAAHTRPACIQAINTYYRNHLAPLVVCSRSHEYLVQETRLVLPSAVVVQPLTLKQVMDYLKRRGRSTTTVRSALQKNQILQDLMTTPLMLNIVIQACQGTATKDLFLTGSAEEQQRQIFTLYKERMLQRHLSREKFHPQSIERFLIWLASQMQHFSLTDFYPERLQADWLPAKRDVKVYKLLLAMTVGLLCGPLVYLAARLASSSDALVDGLMTGAISAIFVASLLRDLKMAVEGFGIEIRITDLFIWWKQTLFIPVIWMILYLASGLANGKGSLLPLLEKGLAYGLIMWVIGIFLPELLLHYGTRKRAHLATMHVQSWKERTASQRIWLTGRTASIYGLVFGILIWALNAISPLAPKGYLAGPIVGLFVGLYLGGFAFLQHHLLRLLFWWREIMPCRLFRLLEEAADRSLLNRVGAGYRFLHPLFQEYLASLSPEVTSSSQHTLLFIDMHDQSNPDLPQEEEHDVAKENGQSNDDPQRAHQELEEQSAISAADTAAEE